MLILLFYFKQQIVFFMILVLVINYNNSDLNEFNIKLIDQHSTNSKITT